MSRYSASDEEAMRPVLEFIARIPGRPASVMSVS